MKNSNATLENAVQTGSFKGVRRFEVGSKYLPQPDYLEFNLPNSHVVLVTNDGSELTPWVVAALKEKGNQVVVLNLKGIANPISENAINLTDISDASIGKSIEDIRERFGKVGGFIYLHPHFEFKPPLFAQHFQKEKELVKALFFIAKYLDADLNELGITNRANFITCTRMDGKLGQGKRGNVSIVGGGITGLVKCLNLEWSAVFCRALDIQPELSYEQIAKQLIAEYHDPNVSIIEVGFSEEGRNTTTSIPVEVIENQTIQTTISSQSVFLVSGGARGVTATCVVEMAKTFQCKFILLGRSGVEFEIPVFAQDENDESTLKRLIMMDMKERGEAPSLPKVKQTFKQIIAKKEIEETLTKIKSFGGEVVYIKGDVTKLDSFKNELQQATNVLGKVTGVIHGAGRLADKYIRDKSESDFENVLSVKLDGVLSLLAAIDVYHLDHLILFSSVAGFYGNVGQTDYAIANEILSKAAHLFKTNHPKTQVSAINWGAWDSGMVSGELKAQFEAAGISLVNSEGGAAMMVNELNTMYTNQPQVIIGGTLPAAVSHIGALKTHRIHRKLKLKNNPFLNHHKIQNNPVLPVVNAVGWMAHSCEEMYPDFRVFKIEKTALFKGIIFDGNENEDYILQLKEIEKSSDKIVFETTVQSDGNKLPVNHYKATITLVNKKEMPAPPHFNHQISGTYQPTDGQILYEDGSLFHDQYFQGIEEVVDCTDQQIVLSCIAEEVPYAAQGQFPIASINTFFADIQYQGMLVWVQKNFDGAKSLPLQTDCATLYQPIPFGKKLFVNVTVQESNDVKLVADCTVYDEEGKVYIKTEGATVTISKQLVW